MKPNVEADADPSVTAAAPETPTPEAPHARPDAKPDTKPDVKSDATAGATFGAKSGTQSAPAGEREVRAANAPPGEH